MEGGEGRETSPPPQRCSTQRQKKYTKGSTGTRCSLCTSACAHTGTRDSEAAHHTARLSVSACACAQTHACSLQVQGQAPVRISVSLCIACMNMRSSDAQARSAGLTFGR